MPCLGTRLLRCHLHQQYNQQVLPQPSPCLGRSLALQISQMLLRRPAYTVEIHLQWIYSTQLYSQGFQNAFLHSVKTATLELP